MHSDGTGHEILKVEAKVLQQKQTRQCALCDDHSAFKQILSYCQSGNAQKEKEWHGTQSMKQSRIGSCGLPKQVKIISCSEHPKAMIPSPSHS